MFVAFLPLPDIQMEAGNSLAIFVLEDVWQTWEQIVARR
jgi:hypothetical protein